MKKLIIIIASVFVFLIAGALTVPLFFVDHMTELILKETNKSLKAKVDFDKLKISFLKNFPYASVSLKDLSIIGIAEFEKDTLINASDLTFSVDAMSLIGGEMPVLKLFSIQDASINLKVLADGQTNWDIFLSDTAVTATPTDSSQFEMMLRKIEMENCHLIYDDRESDIYFAALGINAQASGDFANAVTELALNASIDKVDYSYAGMTFMKSLSANANGVLKADFNRFRFTFEDATLKLNNLNALLEGWLELPEEGFDMDLKLHTEKQGLPEFLSIVPGVYMESLSDFKSDGEVQISLGLKGKFNELTWPGVEFTLKVENANLSSPQIPQKIEKINLEMDVRSPQNIDLDKAVINVQRFDFSSGKNYLNLNAHLSDLISNPKVFVKLKADLKLDEIAKLLPVDGFQNAKGSLKSNLFFDGDLKSLENKQFQKIKAEGNFNLTDFEIESDSMKGLKVENLELLLQPELVKLSNSRIYYGNSDLQMSGRIDNLVSYLLSDQMLKAAFVLNSNRIDLSDFMENTNGTETDTAQMSLIDIPQNLDVNLALNAGKLKMSDIAMDNVNGKVHIYKGKAELDNLKFGLLDGTMVASGFYQSASKELEPAVHFKFDVQNLSFVEAAQKLTTISKLAPILNQAVGNFSMKLDFSSKLLQDFSPDLKSIISEGFLKSENVSLSNSPLLTQLVSSVSAQKDKDFSIKDLNLAFQIQDGNLITKPFKLNLGPTSIQLSGMTNLSQEIDYTGTAYLEDGKLSLFGENIKEINFGIAGTFKNPKINVDTKSLSKTVVKSAVKSAAKELLKVENDEALHAKIAQLRKDAQLAADEILSKADAEANKLEASAKTTLAKLAAKKAGEQIRLEAKKQSDKIINATELKVQELLK